MFKQMKLKTNLLEFLQRNQPIAFSNAEDLYTDLILLRDEVLRVHGSQNELIDYLNVFIDEFDTSLSTTTSIKINQLVADGTLGQLINQVLLGEINDKVDDFSDEVTAQLAETNQQVDDFLVQTNKQLDDFSDEFTVQLARMMTRVDFDSWVATLLDGGPSIFVDSLSVLNSTYPNGAVGVALVRDSEPVKLYAWNNGEWQFLTNYVPNQLEEYLTTENESWVI